GALAERQAGQDPPYGAAVAVLPTGRDQGQLAALAAHRRPFPFRAARRAITANVRAWRTGLRRSEAGAVHLRDLQRGQVHVRQAAHVDRDHLRPGPRIGALAERRDAAGRAEMVREVFLVEAVGAVTGFR